LQQYYVECILVLQD